MGTDKRLILKDLLDSAQTEIWLTFQQKTMKLRIVSRVFLNNNP